jgi:hypothetical protein
MQSGGTLPPIIAGNTATNVTRLGRLTRFTYMKRKTRRERLMISARFFIRRHARNSLVSLAPVVPAQPPALAVIDGTLFRLTRKGATAGFLPPLATAVLEFHRGPLCTYVREHPSGLLPGIPNLYCVDASLRLQWMADWPDPADPCTRILDVTANAVIAEAASGATVILDAFSGTLLRVEHPNTATG